MNKFKLNNHGWGLQAMLAGILVLLIALIVAAILIDNIFGDNNENTDDSSSDVTYVDKIV